MGNKSKAEEYFSKLTFYNEVYKELDSMPNSYAEGRYALQIKIIRDLTKEIGGD